jgi:hypothetical protein
MAGDGIYTCPYHYGKVVSQDWGQLCYHYYCCYYYCCYQPAMTAITPAICNLYIYIYLYGFMLVSGVLKNSVFQTLSSRHGVLRYN